MIRTLPSLILICTISDSNSAVVSDVFQFEHQYTLRDGNTSGSLQNSFNGSKDVAFGPDGSLAVAEYASNRVQVFNSAGTFLENIGGTGSGVGLLDEPFGVSYNSQGDLAVADARNRRVQIFRNGGGVSVIDGSSAPLAVEYGPGDVLGAVGLSFAKVSLYSNTNSFLNEFGTRGVGVGELWNPFGVAFSPNGNIAIADKGNHRVQVYDSSGNHLFQIGGPRSAAEGRFTEPSGLDFHPNGILAVSDLNRRVQFFDVNGNHLTTLTQDFSEDGRFLGLEGIDFNDDGSRLAVVGAGRVQVFSVISIPEPSSGMLLVLGSFGLLRRRR